jgi:hypothetical protein
MTEHSYNPQAIDELMYASSALAEVVAGQLELTPGAVTAVLERWQRAVLARSPNSSR